LLDSCRPDLRGWEHRHLSKRFDSKQTFRGHKGHVTAVAWIASGKRILSGSADGSLKVWNTETGKDLFTLDAHKVGVTGVAVRFDGKRLASAGHDGRVKVWDAESGRELLSLGGGFCSIQCVAFSPDGKRIVAGSGNGRLQELTVWDAETAGAIR